MSLAFDTVFVDPAGDLVGAINGLIVEKEQGSGLAAESDSSREAREATMGRPRSAAPTAQEN